MVKQDIRYRRDLNLIAFENRVFNHYAATFLRHYNLVDLSTASFAIAKDKPDQS